ncbi:hypothetical protein K469DRAFT_72090 [Zopfia rhizophila CBS 207.26]|uniref:NB-ARC domain-containing protein n=1 Tax=Zopfia rhizophila CBS 207.26 TaxID=1314779 RepID=A0A6A6EDI4_9PEZI|nr:hypothetical protein K469DRAFT_72090 [Zopfia rhizophila CBS 207.26]
MVPQSLTSVKVTDIPRGTTEEQYRMFLEHLFTEPPKPAQKKHKLPIGNKFKRKFRGGSSPAKAPQPDDKSPQQTPAHPKEWHSQTFASQEGCPVGTITFASEELKKKAIQRHQADRESIWQEWRLTDEFDHLTVLQDPGDDTEADICAVHGLGGNAMDTWTSTDTVKGSSRMWLCDFLPEADYFKCRIMTFGYDSGLRNSHSVMKIKDWAKSLLRSVDRVRASDAVCLVSSLSVANPLVCQGACAELAQEKQRPLLFVCHSLGGLVARQAMVQLPFEALELPGKLCGLVFLATPHRGSLEAEWSNFLVSVAQVMAGVRPEIVDELRPFNPNSSSSIEDFFRLKPLPPFRCFSEGKKMRIVTQPSATLGENRVAANLMGTDHRTICKFTSNSDANYLDIVKALNDVRREILERKAGARVETGRIPGHPAHTAHTYPAMDGYWWEVTQMRGVSHNFEYRAPMYGRDDELQKLQTFLSSDESDLKLTMVKGIGGIGKTRLLIEAAITQQGVRSVFLVGASKEESFEKAAVKIASRIGFDMQAYHPSNRDKWDSISMTERASAFMDWLSHPNNKSALLVVDDLDAYEAADIEKVSTCQAWHIVVSTRDSTLRTVMSLHENMRIPQEICLSPLHKEPALSILRNTPRSPESSSYSAKDMEAIVNITHGHPLAIRLFIPFLMYYQLYEPTVLDEMCGDSYSDSWNDFMNFKTGNLCLSDCFALSQSRLKGGEVGEQAKNLLRLLPFLKLNTSPELVEKFFELDKTWLKDDDVADPGRPLFSKNLKCIRHAIRTLQATSVCVQDPSRRLFECVQLHPLLRKYLLLQLSQEDLIRSIREIVIVCHGLIIRNPDQKSVVLPQLKHCFDFKISVEDLKLPISVFDWIQTLENDDDRSLDLENTFDDPAGEVKETDNPPDDLESLALEESEVQARAAASLPKAYMCRTD